MSAGNFFPFPASRSCKNGAKIEKIMNNLTNLTENTFRPAFRINKNRTGQKSGTVPNSMTRDTCQYVSHVISCMQA